MVVLNYLRFEIKTIQVHIVATEKGTSINIMFPLFLIFLLYITNFHPIQWYHRKSNGEHMRLFWVVSLLFLICTACGRIPEPIGYTYSQQEKMQAAHHWEVLAKDLSNKINNELIRSDFLETAVYVQETCGDESKPCEKHMTTEFNEGFRDLLITELVSYGIPTSSIPDREAITIHYKVQSVHHQTKRLRTLRPGLITALTTAVSVIRNAPTELVAIALSAGVDYANTTYAKKSDYEIIITTSMIFRQHYLFRSSDIYYINGADYHHYQHDKNDKATTIELTSNSSY